MTSTKPNNTDMTDEVLAEYEEELEYYDETHPVVIEKPTGFKSFLIRANTVSQNIGKKMSDAINSPTAKKVDGFLRDMAARQSDSLGGDDSFNIRDIGRDTFDREQQPRQHHIPHTIPHNTNQQCNCKKCKKKRNETKHAAKSNTRSENNPLSNDNYPLSRRGNDHL
jgi:hypothetical protein